MNVPQNQASTKKVAFFNNPANRAVIYQALLMVGLGYFFYTIISNTLANMEARGIKSGFDFLWGTAGFDILMSLIPYEPTDTYGRTFIVGMLNTVLVSSIGIVLSTVVGFVMGVAYFSHNWLIRKIATVYVETFRNIPLLLQVFFWYFAVLSALPSARQSLSLGEAIFLNVRGLYLPDAVGEPGSGVVYAAIAVAIAAIALLRRWAKRRQALTGKQFPLLYAT
ncbi:MAG: ABC transporter permease subunit, partial [Gammaproteobacteria bacterium]|nr:ABC transporter permease subunit [Gammaproteobacteria bacterium]